VRIVVIGTGHVGLVTCATLAALSHDVVGTDADQEKISGLRQGIVPFHEPGLEPLVEEHTKTGRLRFTEDASDDIADADIVFICVNTPPRSSGEANLVAVEQAVRHVARHAAGRTVVVEKSTVPAGTAQRIRQILLHVGNGSAKGLEVVSNPEFLREGSAVRDSLEPDRILVGAEGGWAFEYMRELYAPLTAKGVPLIETDINTAELAKHACNAFLALKISYVNALARICERADADVVAVAEIMGADPRIGPAFLHAGLGYGGSCFPKDLQAFDHLAANLHYDFPLLREIERINHEAVDATLERIRAGIWNLEHKRVALLGLAFKAGTDDVRFSPQLALADRLLQGGATVAGYDPQAMSGAKEACPSLLTSADPYEAAADAHCVVVCTDWAEFRSLDLARLREAMAEPFIVDGRNLLDPTAVTAAGFAYSPTGRPGIR
jgi:UDPglucose 6-dehydrogenase